MLTQLVARFFLNMIFWVVARVLLGGCYANAVGFYGIPKWLL